jgi:outer membrane receptor protein involved in Fe transport
MRDNDVGGANQRGTARWFRCGLAALVASLALVPVNGSAQEQGRIAGRVLDAATQAPLSEVQIYLVGANLGSLSRANGAFVIVNVPAGSYELRAERIGLTTVTRQITVAAGQTQEVNFEMSSQALGLDEIVVTGTAGASRRREIGNSIAQINTAELPVRPTTAGELLLSAAPGVEVTLGGETGMGTRIRLRGENSINNDNPPIIYIDGVRIHGDAFARTPSPDQGNRFANVNSSPLDMINPNDIDRLEVIKGSAATTLYGTEASGGVIQIFTKRGSQGAPVWTVETQQGTIWSQPYGAGDHDNGFGGTSAFLYMDPWSCTGFLKCGDLMPGPAHTQVYSGSVRGGGQTLQYFSSGDFTTEQGNTIQDHMDRWAVRGNFTFSPFSDLVLQWNNGYTNQAQQNTPTGNNAEGLQLNVFRQNQNYFANKDSAIINQMLTQDLIQQAERFTTGGTITYSPLASFTNRVTIGYDHSSQENRHIRPFGFPSHPEGTAYNATAHRRLLTFDYVGSLSFDLMSSVRSTFSWGGQSVGNETRSVRSYGWNFPGSANPTVTSGSSTLGYEDRQRTWNAGFFLQNVFDIANKYFVTLGMRADGNSTFGKDFGLQVYPKASATWVLSDESFWNPSFGELKLRSAFGKSGRPPSAIASLRTWTNTGIGGNPAFTPDNVGNPELGPEVTSEFEAGFDAAWLDNRITTAFTYYKQTTTDAIQGRQQIPSLGFTANQQVNVGKVQNQGTELQVNLTAIRTRDWGWDLGINWATNSNEVLAWEGTPERVGRPINYSTWTDLINRDVVLTQEMVAQGRAAAQGNGGFSALSCFTTNPDPVTGDPGVRRATLQEGDPCTQQSWIRFGFPQNLAPQILSGNTTVRLPYGISLAARGEFRGGNWATGINPISISRSVRSPACFPYYANEENVQLKNDTPALWVHRCTPTIGNQYQSEGEYFKMRSVTATVPMDFAFPDRVQNAVLTMTLGNIYTWKKDALFGTYGIESSGNDGANDRGNGFSSNERTPPPASFRASLRVTF